MARAMELFPPHLADNDFHGLTKRDLNEPYRKAFLKCWEEMQQNKQTCGFCVEPISPDHNNIPESVYNGNIKESDANQSKQEEDELLKQTFEKPIAEEVSMLHSDFKEQPKGRVKVEKDHWMNTHGKQEEWKSANIDIPLRSDVHSISDHTGSYASSPISEQPKDNGLREAAEKVVVVNHMSSIRVPIEVERAIEQLAKALK